MDTLTEKLPQPTPEEWARLKELFGEALDLRSSARFEFVRNACADQPELLRQLEDLLEKEAESGPIVRTGLLSSDRVFEYLSAGLRSFEEGDIVGGRFQVVRFLGQGGMGEVYSASDRELGVIVALKTLRPAISSLSDLVARFKHEIQLARKVTHPGVSRIFDLSWHHQPGKQPMAFLTMELLDGETLAARIGRLGNLTLAESLSIATQLAEGIRAAHAAGIVHRDFKSSNILLDAGAACRAVITDFGLALERGTNPAAGDIAGTPAYVAPEQLTGNAVTAATDIYSFGIVLFEMISGRLPFIGDSPWEVAQARLNGPAPRLRSILPKADPKWDRAIAACLERDPERRPKSAEAVLDILKGNQSSRRYWFASFPLAASAAGMVYYFHRPPFIQPDALIRFKRAEEFARRRNAEGIANAITEFQAAIAIQPNYADAWAGLAEAHSANGNFHFADPRIALPKAREAARTAIQIDGRSARAHGVLAYCTSIDVHEWLKAGSPFLRALSLDQRNPQLHLWYGSYLGKLRRPAEAIVQVKTGLSLDPTSLAMNTQLAAEYYRARDLDNYFRQAQECVRMFPFEATAYLVLARGYEWRGDWKAALEACAEGQKYRISQASDCVVGSIEAGRGNLAQARAVAAKVEQFWTSKPFETILLAALYARIGDLSKAIFLLNAGFERNDGTILMAPAHPHFDPVRNQPGYLEFLHRIGLTA